MRPATVGGVPYKEYMLARYHRRRAKAIDSMGGACARCGSTEKLEVDHIDPATKISHRIWTWSETRLRAELAKCQLLCRPCHHAKTGSEKRTVIVHGTARGYWNGCRCDACREANRESNRRRKKRPSKAWTDRRAKCRCAKCVAERLATPARGQP